MVPFTWADEFWSFLRRREREQGASYDGLLVDEGPGGEYDRIAVVPLHVDQIKSIDNTTFDTSSKGYLE